MVPLDESTFADRAVPVAAAVARRLEIPLVPVIVRPPYEWREHLHREALTNHVGSLPGVETTPLVLEADDVGRAIADAADGALLVMTSHGHTGVGEILIGGTTTAVLRRRDEETLVVGPECRAGADPTTGRLVMAVDATHDSEVIASATRVWCDSFDMEPWVVTALDRGDAPPDTGDVLESSHLKVVASELGSRREAQWDVLHDGRHPAVALCDYLDRVDAGIVALATHARSGIERLVLGGVAMKVVHSSPCPVLLVGPTTPTETTRS